MRRQTLFTLLLAVCLHCCSDAQQFFGTRYLGEIGHLNAQRDRRTSVSLGPANVIADREGNIRFEGLDVGGKTWRATLPIEGGVGWTTAWQADFDRNSRIDLMIAAYFPQNGRCIDRVTISFLMFDASARPVPWEVSTQIPKSHRFPMLPAILTDLNSNGRAELVATDCQYSEPPRFGVDREITGVYEAQDAKWQLVRPPEPGRYLDLVRANHDFDRRNDRLLPVEPARWLDRGNELVPNPAPVRLTNVLPAFPGCGGIRLGPIVDGRIQPLKNDPCNEIGKNRLVLSDGTTCYGWPLIVLDGTGGRQIIAQPSRTMATLREIMRRQLTVLVAGETVHGRCSPTVLWAEEPQ